MLRTALEDAFRLLERVAENVSADVGVAVPCEPGSVRQRIQAVLSLSPSPAAAAVQELVEAAQVVVETWYPEGETPDCVETLREALKPFAGVQLRDE